METIGEIFDTTPQRFQQTTTVLHAHDVDNAQENWTTTSSYESEELENGFLNEDDDLVQILKGFLEEFDVEGHEMLKKFVSRVEKDVPIERLIRDTLHDFNGRHVSDKLEKFVTKLNNGGKNWTSTERDVNGDNSRLKHKLERFKVKAVNVIGSGVVKEEGQ